MNNMTIILQSPKKLQKNNKPSSFEQQHLIFVVKNTNSLTLLALNKKIHLARTALAHIQKYPL